MNEPQTEQWFKDHAGKQVLRKLKSGRIMNFYIIDEEHAHNVFMMQEEMGYRYFDEKIKIYDTKQDID